MEELLEILEEINPDVDYSTCTTLIDDHLLDSFAILSLVSEIGIHLMCRSHQEI